VRRVQEMLAGSAIGSVNIVEMILSASVLEYLT
jgi:hypothetical protein